MYLPGRTSFACALTGFVGQFIFIVCPDSFLIYSLSLSLLSDAFF